MLRSIEVFICYFSCEYKNRLIRARFQPVQNSKLFCWRVIGHLLLAVNLFQDGEYLGAPACHR